MRGLGGPFNNIQQDFQNVTAESRYYLGFDSRYRLGNVSIEPTFIYLLGTRKFCTPRSTVNSTGTLTPCGSSATAGRSDIDFSGLETQLVVQYTFGNWLWAGKFGYRTGNNADDDLNDRGNGRRSSVGYRPLGIDGFNRLGEWFEILGRAEADGVGIQSPYRYGEIGTLDRFGWQSFGLKSEYKLRDRLTLEGALGFFWTAKNTGCPAVLRTATGACGGPLNNSGEPGFNFTGNSRYAGSEVDVGFRYTIMPGLVWTPRFGYAFLGGAFDTNNRSSQNAWVLANRMIYLF